MKKIKLALTLAAALAFAVSIAPTTAKADFFSTNWQPMGMYAYFHGVHTYNLYVLLFGSTASAVYVQTYPPHVSHAALTRCSVNGFLQTYSSGWNHTSVTDVSFVTCAQGTAVDAGGWFID